MGQMVREDENLYHRRDPQVACGVRCSKVTLRSAEWEATPLPMTACGDKQGDPVETVAEGESAQHQPGFLQTIH